MPTIAEWQNALNVPRIVRLNATDDLADQVNSLPKTRSFKGRPKVATGLSKFSPFQSFLVKPIELLYAMGRITTPRIPNLADLCSTWARIRYIWAFDPNPRRGQLCLSNETRNIDTHQKAVLSDEVGVGMAALILDQFFQAKNPVDVSVVLKSKSIPGLRAIYTTSPDYIFETDGGDYIVVECKCTMTGMKGVLKQLKRGTEQVPSLKFKSGAKPLTLVVGTGMTNAGSFVNIIDPPASEAEQDEDSSTIIIADEKEFRQDIKRAQIANFYHYVGAERRALEFDDRALQHSEDFNLDPPNRFRLGEMEENYVGVIAQFSLLGVANQISIFQGMPESLYQALTRSRFQDFDEMATAYFKKAQAAFGQVTDRPRPGKQTEMNRIVFFSEHTNNSLQDVVFGTDGTILRVEIS